MTAPLVTDKACGNRKRGGADETAYETAYVSLFLPAMRLAHRMTGDRAAAEDIAAEALARAYARWNVVRAMTNPNAWVMRVVSNLAIDALRRRHDPPTTADVEAFDELATLRLALAAALRRLPRRQQESLVLHYIGGLSDVEVSASLGIAASSVRTHLQRGLATLRERLIDGPDIAVLTSHMSTRSDVRTG